MNVFWIAAAGDTFSHKVWFLIRFSMVLSSTSLIIT